MSCAIHVPFTFACSQGSPLHGTNLSGRAAMTTASPSLHETAIVSLTLPAALAIRDGHVARQRAANASSSLWLQTLASNAGPAKTVVGSGKRPTQTTARRLRYGVARTDTSDFSAPRGSHHRGDMWIHRIGWCAEEQAARTRVLPSGLLLWIDGGRDPARKASRPERARSRRPVR
jgi:hypothetical protein